MLHLIEKLGSFAGLFAFLGLAVLALLYFAQARDVRRLRDWAGQAPESVAAVDEPVIDPAQVAAIKRAEEERLAAEEARKAAQLASSERIARMQRRHLGQREPLSTRIRGWVPEPRYLALIVAGVVILGAGAAVGATQLLGGSSSGGGGGKHAGGGSRVIPSHIQVAVLNGTAVPGLAAKVGDDVTANGFKLGAVTNSRSSFSSTIVMYERGHAREAKAVGHDIGVKHTRLITGEIRGIAGGARVAVVVGQDRASL